MTNQVPREYFDEDRARKYAESTAKFAAEDGPSWWYIMKLRQESGKDEDEKQWRFLQKYGLAEVFSWTVIATFALIVLGIFA